MVRILIADDHVIIREGLKRILETAGEFDVVGEAASGPEVLDRARTTHPDVVLLDVTMPGQGGIETVKDLKRENPQARVLILTVHPEDHFAVRCLKDGVDGYLTKDAAPEQLVQAIRRVQRGGKYISPNLAERLALSLDGDFGHPAHEGLSDREFEVMQRLGSGQTVGDIAAELNLSVKTVSTYRARILEKMNLRNNAELMRYVLAEGLAA